MLYVIRIKREDRKITIVKLQDVPLFNKIIFLNGPHEKSHVFYEQPLYRSEIICQATKLTDFYFLSKFLFLYFLFPLFSSILNTRTHNENN